MLLSLSHLALQLLNCLLQLQLLVRVLSSEVLQLLLAHHDHLLRLGRYLLLGVQVSSLLSLFKNETVSLFLILFVVQLGQVLPIDIDANVDLFLLSRAGLLRLPPLAEQ